MPRNNRKQIVGKIAENVEIKLSEIRTDVLAKLVKRDWWTQRRGQIPAGEVLPLCPLEQREREQARRAFLAMDPFEHREE